MSIHYWFGSALGFHGGDKQPGDIEVQSPPDFAQLVAGQLSAYDWDGAAWVVNADRAAAAAAAANAAQGASLAMSAILADPTIQFLMTHQPQECYTAVQQMVVDLPTAKDMIGKLAMALCALVRIQAGSVDNAN